MIGIALKLMGIGKWLREASSAFREVIRDHPWQVALIASLALTGALWHGGNVARGERDAQIAGRAADILAVEAAQVVAKAKALAQLKATEQRYTNLAKDADNDHTTKLADAGGAADRYIATHRVQQCKAAGNTSSRSVAAAEGGNPSVSESLPANPLVAVSDDDVQKCTAAVIYGVSAHNWAIGLKP